MQIKIEGTTEEIAALVLVVQGQHGEVLAPVETIREVVQKAIGGIVQEAQAAL